VPHYLFASGADIDITPLLRVSAWVNAQGDYYLERTNSTGRFGRRFLVNLGAAYKATKDLTLEFQVRNATNQYYEYVWHDGTQSLHSPGDKRAFFGAATLNF
jgi:iron complex outermembrane receptor protein